METLQSVGNELSRAPDALLVERSGDGDVAAFDALVRRYAPLMRAYARRLLRSDEEADDVMQEALIAAWQDMSSLRDGSAVKSWLMRIVSHRAIDAGRRRKSHGNVDEEYELEDTSTTPEQAAVAGSAQRALNEALARLPEEQRQCWILREFGGQSYEEIAKALEISVTSVRGRLARARTALVTEMEEWR